MAKLPMKNSRLFGIVTGKMVDRVMHFVHLATILVKDEEFTRRFEHGEKHLLLKSTKINVT